MRYFCTSVAVIVLAATGSAQAAAPGISGIYLSSADFTDGRLTAEGHCGSVDHKLELHDVLNKSYIHVTHGAAKQRYEKNDLFGFRACDGNDYRFVSNREYRILEAREFYIYEHEAYVSVGKSRHIVKEYSFSVGRDGKVIPLTLENLKRAFPDNHAFHDSLDQTFGGGQDLTQYDQFHKMFKVNRLLIATRTP
jgi:hypothetical protein